MTSTHLHLAAAAEWPDLPRFWCPRGESFSTDEAGFLVDPDEGRWGNRAILATPGLTGARCRVLLGEPGMGKTRAVTHLRAELPVAATVFVDLAGVVSPDGLHRRLFASDRWDAWRGGGGDLHLVLDSFDESVVSLDRGVTVLRGAIQGLPTVDRLTLTVASRGGAWPAGLEAVLADRWGTGMGVFELCPLRRRDVEVILAAADVDPGAFFRGLDRAGCHVLAARPQTLRLLVRVFRRTGELPADRHALYEQATLELCEEPNVLYREANRTRTLTTAQRQAVAGRVAVTTLFCGRRGVWTGPEVDAPPDLVPVSALAGADERAEGRPFGISADGVREALRDTALFTSPDGHTVLWAHRSYAEFLAARHLADRGVAAEQLDTLFLHPSGRGVVPPLLSAAGWAGRDLAGWFRTLAGRDPAVLLGLDPTAADDALKGWAAGAVLSAAAAGRLHDRDLDDQDYRRFGHPGLADVLRPWVTDRSREFVARRMAFDMAAANGVGRLQDELVASALDPAEDRHLRRFAARAVAKIGDTGTRGRLRGLFDLPPDQDPDDDLLATAVELLWPDLVPTPDAFRALRRPRRPDRFDSYPHFLAYTLPQRLRPSDLPVALDWLATFVDHETSHWLGELQTRLLVEGWGRADEPAVRAALARALWSLVGWHRPFLDRRAGETVRAAFLAAADSRQQLLGDLLPLAAAVVGKSGAPTLVLGRLLRPDDAGWLVTRLREATEPGVRQVLVNAADQLCVYHAGDPAVLAALVPAYREDPDPDLRAALAGYFEPVGIHSADADRLRAARLRHLAVLEPQQQPETPHPPPAAQLAEVLTQVGAGRVEAWPALTQALLLIQPSPLVHLFLLDISAVPGWRELRPADRRAAGRAAELFVRRYGPRGRTEWLAGVKALHLLRARNPRRFRRLPRSVWRRWVRAIVAYPATGHSDDGQRALFVDAYRMCPRATGRTLADVIRGEDGRKGSTDVSSLARAVWEPAVAARLRPLLRALRPRAFGRVLGVLVEHGDEESVARARSLLDRHEPGPARERLCAFEAATTLMRHAAEAFWPLLAAATSRRPEFFRGWVKYLAKHEREHDFARWGTTRPPAQIGQLLAWLIRHFPPAPDKEDQSGWERPRDRITNWRRGLLSALGDAGTIEALAALEDIATAHPGVDHIGWRLVDARTRTLAQTWHPPRPDELTRLLGDARTRLVRSADELLAVVAESVGRYEQELQGATPSAFQLWDDLGPAGLRPKSEQRLSDSVLLHLRRDLAGRGVVLNREVVIRERIGPRGTGRPGERTDIQVDAVGSDPSANQYTTITVIVEVKGSWNDDVYTAMESQLRDRYLADNHCSHGLYLVGWFRCPQWGAADPRQGADQRLHPGDLVATRSRLAAQAARANTGRFRILSCVLAASLR